MKKDASNENGFSLVELLIVLTVIAIMSAVTGYYLTNHRKAYKPDDQASHLIDLFQEARQRSLTQKEVMRVEIDLDDKVVRLIDENEPDNDADDRLIRSVALQAVNDVKINSRPSEILVNPPETPAVSSADFRPSTYPSSVTHNVCTLRFKINHTVVGAVDSITPVNTVLYVWSPKKSDASQSDIARAITIMGATGSIRLWEYNRTSTAANKWIDSRRTGGYGQGN